MKKLISKEGIKEFFRKNDLRVSTEFYDTLETELRNQLAKVAKRTEGNRRVTVLSLDL